MIDDKKEMKYKIIILRLQNSTSLIYLSLFHEFIYSPSSLWKYPKKKEMAQRLKNTTEIIRSLT